MALIRWVQAVIGIAYRIRGVGIFVAPGMEGDSFVKGVFQIMVCTGNRILQPFKFHHIIYRDPAFVIKVNNSKVLITADLLYGIGKL